MKKISAVILCHNNNHITDVVDILIKQLKCGDELFVVDDHSNDEVRKMLEKYNDTSVQVLFSIAEGNRAANRNLAANLAQGDLLLFVDGDVLIENGAIDLIRAFNYEGITGLCGSVAAMRMTPETIAIVTHNFSNQNQIDKADFPLWHNFFPDIRNIQKSLPWNRFYTAYCVIPRIAFNIAGKFDERFLGWGGEDIDLGYRLSKIGNLVISQDIRAVHIPHPRNIRQEEINGRKNMYEMLKKYRNRDIEELISFASTPYVTEGINSVLDRLRLIEDKSFIIANSLKDMVYYAVSSKNPNGLIIYYVDGQQIKEEFLGLALPFENSVFDLVMTTTAIFDYPEGIATRILQELLRVSKKVKIAKISTRVVRWGKMENVFKHVFCYYKTYSYADSYLDFNIEDFGSYYIVT